MKVTIQSIAEACGMSITAVSLVLNNKPSRISKEKRELIIETAKKMNYMPNPNAVGLAGGRTRSIGLILTDIGNMFLSEMSRVIETELRDVGYTLLMGNTGDSSEKELEYLREFIGKKVEGIILLHASDATEKLENEMKALIQSTDIPLVMLENDLQDLEVMRCVVDHELGGYLAVKHLIEQGHQRIGSLLGPIGQCSVRKRLKGYRRALEEAKLPYDPELLYQGDFTMKTGRESVPYFIEKGVSAIFSYNDMMAYGVLEYAKENGIVIGEDLALIGYDDSFINGLLEVPLSSVYQPRTEVAKKTAKCLADAISGKVKKNKTIIFKPELRVRKSTEAKYNG